MAKTAGVETRRTGTGNTASGVGDTRERILAAALEAFSENGFDGATTRDIAARAEVNLGLIQYHFGGKAKLWRAAVDLAFSRMRTGLDAAAADPELTDDRDRVRRLIRAYVRFVARNPEFVRIMHDEGKRRGPRMRWLADRHARPMYESLTQLIERSAVGSFMPPDISPVHFMYILVGAVGIIFHQSEECKRLTGVDPMEDAVVEAHADAIEHLLLGQ